MTPQTNKTASRLLLTALAVAFLFAACKGKGEKKEEPPKDTATVQPAEPQPVQPGPDTARTMPAPADTAKQKPVKEPG